jgi:Mg-chelatase subunit ChlI
MKYRAFPFTAIKGQEEMKMALLLNVIDPKIGGVLLTGQQGTGKTTAVRSLSEILPPIKVTKGCPFNCDPMADDHEICDICKENRNKADMIYERPIPLVNLPLGVTEDMVVGSLDIERILSSGIKALNPGLLAKANRGILYIDEINLLQDHIIDILLDSSATGINIIEREGISLTHSANFILVGSMNPEEGELRPQIQDRLGLEVKIRSPEDPNLRALITKDVIEFTDNPEGFLKKYENKQNELRYKLIEARKLVKKIQVPDSIYLKVGELVRQAGVYSQRADITLIRCARAHAALEGRDKVIIQDFEAVFKLVFGHRMKSNFNTKDPEYYESEMKDILGKIKEAIEDPEKYKPNWDLDQNTLKYTKDSQKEYKENPLDKDNMNIPEWNDEGGGTSKNRFTDQQRDFDQPPGYKVGKTRKYVPPPVEKELNKDFEADIKKIDNIFHHFRRRKGQGSFSGRGNRAKILSELKGAYLTYREPQGRPKSIAFDASLKFFYSEYFQSDTIYSTFYSKFLRKRIE